MSDDLVKRLRVRAEFTGPYSALWDEAADRIEKLEDGEEEWNRICNRYADHYAARIEKLEAALREIAEGYATEWSLNTFTTMLDVAQILSEKIHIARKALEGKDD